LKQEGSDEKCAQNWLKCLDRLIEEAEEERKLVDKYGSEQEQSDSDDDDDIDGVDVSSKKKVKSVVDEEVKESSSDEIRKK